MISLHGPQRYKIANTTSTLLYLLKTLWKNYIYYNQHYAHDSSG